MENPSRTLMQLAELLKRKYLENPHIERLFYPDNPLSLEQCYLHLALIEEKKVNDDKSKNNDLEKDEYAKREFFLHEYERIEHIQRKLDVKDMLAECKQTPKRIYIEGVAGAGKSTLSRYIVHQWSLNQEPWKQYCWVFHIRLRELTENNYTEKNTELLKVFERECFGLGHGTDFKKEERKSLEKAMRQNPNQVLLVLDGVDELQLTTNYVREIWQSLINSNYDLLFTSRPGAQLIKRDLRINLSLGVLGFSDEQVERYIKNFFNPGNTPNIKTEDANNCLNVLKNNWNLWSLAHTPIQLELLCSIWGEELRQQELNLTNLYCLMSEKLLKRFEQLQLKQQGKIVNLDEIDIVPLKEKYQHQLHYMEYLAFQGMQGKIIVLGEKHINESYNRLPRGSVKAVEFYQKLKGLGLVKRYNNGKQAEFAHLTFQELFAAKYIARAIKAYCEGKVEGLKHEALFEFIRQTKWDLFYEVMWWFVAGLLAGKSNQQQELECYKYQAIDNIEFKLPKSHTHLQRLQVLFDLLLQEPRTYLGFQELCLLARCLDEARLPDVMQKESIIIHIQYYYEHCMKNSNNIWNIAFEKIKNIVKFCPIIVKYRIMNEFIKILQNDEYIGSRTFKADSTRSQGEAVPELYNPSLLRAAITSLGELGHVGPDIAIPALIKVLKSKDRRVRYVAAEALGKVGHLALEQVISELLEALLMDDKDWLVRNAAIYSLRVLGNEVPKKIIPVWLELLKNKDKYFIYFAAAEALGELGHQAQFEIIPTLIEVLKDGIVECDILSGILVKVAKETPKNVTINLLELLKDKNWKVVCYAAATLGEFGQVEPEKIFSALHEILKDKNENWKLRFETVRSLGRLGDVIPEKIIPVMFRLLKDKKEDKYVRRRVAYSLENLFKASPEKIISTLLEILKDECDKDVDLRNISAGLLGKLYHIAPKKIFPALLEILKDKNVSRLISYNIKFDLLDNFELLEQVVPELLEASKDIDDSVRYKAIDSLSKLCQIMPEKIIPVLFEILNDKDWNIRLIAFTALTKLETIPSKKVIPIVLDMLEYSDIYLDPSKFYILEEFLKAAPDKIIAILIELSNLEYINLHSAAREHLGKLGNILPSKVITSLSEAVKTKKIKSQNVIKILREMPKVNIGLYSKELLRLLAEELFPHQPARIPPSCLIRSIKDIPKVDTNGKLLTLHLCGEVMESMIKNNQESHVINHDFWTISIVRKREDARNNNTSSSFFKSIKFTNGLFDHAFMIIEGVYQSVRFAKRIDLYAERSKASQSSGQKIRIEITGIDDFKRLDKLAENCSCMVQGISRQKAEQLEKIIIRDQEAAKNGEIIYNMRGDGSYLGASRDKKEHSCISWCLEKWQEIGLPLKRKWYDTIVVVPKAYLLEPESEESNKGSSCRIM